jgi:hypothetical protein
MANESAKVKLPTNPISINQPYKQYPSIKYPIIDINGYYYRLTPRNQPNNYSNTTLIKCNPLIFNEEVIPLIHKSNKTKLIWIIGNNKEGVDITKLSCDDLDIWFKQTKSIDEICSKHMNAVRQSKIIHLLYAGEIMFTKQEDNSFLININLASGTFMQPISNNINAHFTNIQECIATVLKRVLNRLEYSLVIHKDYQSFIDKGNVLNINNFIELAGLEHMKIMKLNSKKNFHKMGLYDLDRISLESELQQLKSLKRFYDPKEYQEKIDGIQAKINELDEQQQTRLKSIISLDEFKKQLQRTKNNKAANQQSHSQSLKRVLNNNSQSQQPKKSTKSPTSLRRSTRLRNKK